MRNPITGSCTGTRICFRGVVIDRYGGYLVVQIAVAGFDLLLEDLLAALEKVLHPKGIVVRNNHGAPAPWFAVAPG